MSVLKFPKTIGTLPTGMYNWWVPIGGVDGSGNPVLATFDTGALNVKMAAGTAVIGHVILDSGVLTSITNALPAGTNNIGKVGPAQSSAAPTNTDTHPFTVQTADATVFTLAAGERGYIQNLDTDPLAYKLGASASNSSFSGILPACTVADDGKSSPFIIQSWIGVVSVAAMTGTARYIAWKI